MIIIGYKIVGSRKMHDGKSAKTQKNQSILYRSMQKVGEPKWEGMNLVVVPTRHQVVGIFSTISISI